MENEKPEFKDYLAISFAALFMLALLIILGVLYGLGAIVVVIVGTIVTLSVAAVFVLLFSRN